MPSRIIKALRRKILGRRARAALVLGTAGLVLAACAAPRNGGPDAPPKLPPGAEWLDPAFHDAWIVEAAKAVGQLRVTRTSGRVEDCTAVAISETKLLTVGGCVTELSTGNYNPAAMSVRFPVVSDSDAVTLGDPVALLPDRVDYHRLLNYAILETAGVGRLPFDGIAYSYDPAPGEAMVMIHYANTVGPAVTRDGCAAQTPRATMGARLLHSCPITTSSFGGALFRAETGKLVGIANGVSRDPVLVAERYYYGLRIGSIASDARYFPVRAAVPTHIGADRDADAGPIDQTAIKAWIAESRGAGRPDCLIATGFAEWQGLCFPPGGLNGASAVGRYHFQYSVQVCPSGDCDVLLRVADELYNTPYACDGEARLQRFDDRIVINIPARAAGCRETAPGQQDEWNLVEHFSVCAVSGKALRCRTSARSARGDVLWSGTDHFVRIGGN